MEKPTITQTLDMMPISHFYDKKTGRMVCFADDVRNILEYRDKEVVQYTLQQAADNGSTEDDDSCFESCPECHSCRSIVVDKQSILSLEESIIKELKL